MRHQQKCNTLQCGKFAKAVTQNASCETSELLSEKWKPEKHMHKTSFSKNQKHHVVVTTHKINHDVIFCNEKHRSSLAGHKTHLKKRPIILSCVLQSFFKRYRIVTSTFGPQKSQISPNMSQLCRYDARNTITT